MPLYKPLNNTQFYWKPCSHLLFVYVRKCLFRCVVGSRLGRDVEGSYLKHGMFVGVRDHSSINYKKRMRKHKNNTAHAPHRRREATSWMWHRDEKWQQQIRIPSHPYSSSFAYSGIWSLLPSPFKYGRQIQIQVHLNQVHKFKSKVWRLENPKFRLNLDNIHQKYMD